MAFFFGNSSFSVYGSVSSAFISKKKKKQRKSPFNRRAPTGSQHKNALSTTARVRERVVPRLPNDILYEIFLCLRQDLDSLLQNGISTIDTNAARTAARMFHGFLFVSRQFYSIVRPFLYRAIFLTHGKRVRQLYSSLEKCPSLSSHVRHLFFVEQKDWSGLKTKSGAMPELWQSVKCQRPEVAADWSKMSKARRDVALQLVSILASLENLKTFKYHADIDPLQWSVRDRGSAFDWIFTSLVSTLAARKYGHGFLHTLEEVDITGLSPHESSSIVDKNRSQHCYLITPMINPAIQDLGLVPNLSLRDIRRPQT
ncbi:hypothetical protein BJX66DRAFT_334008 [Aspergillus keveii]|uniref:F-box domain protein n=1 Tax=Aspergillus keveii TaxID=714993 RepID=A0ABR4GJE8_9EURO